MPEERMKERLEMSFSRKSRGGGEVDGVEYDRNNGTGQITFLHPGVAESLALRGRYLVDLDSEVNAQVGPIYKHQLCKFQTFCGSPKHTILLEDIKDMGEEDDLQDHLEIHFQKPSNYGGEIESIQYNSRGKALQAFFSEDLPPTAAR
ncbi:N-myc-interactor-like [Pseudoliparis swirei]|uniref:N-myc-interactor-like n=1 Tax=Pseudoliparis swirei TaxID=2059687 RepID=UPI0024BE25BE|nr:N-myc-interactor-like [Pseudoliparis swirei]